MAESWHCVHQYYRPTAYITCLHDHESQFESLIKQLNNSSLVESMALAGSSGTLNLPWWALCLLAEGFAPICNLHLCRRKPLLVILLCKLRL